MPISPVPCPRRDFVSRTRSIRNGTGHPERSDTVKGTQISLKQMRNVRRQARDRSDHCHICQCSRTTPGPTSSQGHESMG
jgi:hypothetical protein